MASRGLAKEIWSNTTMGLTWGLNIFHLGDFNQLPDPAGLRMSEGQCKASPSAPLSLSHNDFVKPSLCKIPSL